MLKNSHAFSSFSVDDLGKARQFYEKILGLNVTEETLEQGAMLYLHLLEGADILIYPKKDHSPASFTILNFTVSNLEEALAELTEKGLTFDYDNESAPLIAWFRDPAGNFLSIMEDAVAINKIEINKFIPIQKSEVFKAFTQNDLLARWAYVDGTKLVIEQYEAKICSNFIFKYTGASGIYFATGDFKEFTQDEKLVIACILKGPDGSVIFDSTITILFEEKHGGVEIHIFQDELKDRNTLRECEIAWGSALEKLFTYLVRGFNESSRLNSSKERPLDLNQ
jgi:uncharacterized protein YndB with AHSA1/START domain/predicted enzyme related to lactoylglutathione lyase